MGSRNGRCGFEGLPASAAKNQMGLNAFALFTAESSLSKTGEKISDMPPSHRVDSLNRGGGNARQLFGQREDHVLFPDEELLGTGAVFIAEQLDDFLNQKLRRGG